MGLPCRNVSIDDEGAMQRLVTVQSPDFQMLAEFYNKEMSLVSTMFFEQIVAAQKPSIYEGITIHDSVLKSDFVMKLFQNTDLNRTHPIKVLF